MDSFEGRLQKAVERAKVAYSQTAIGALVGVGRQTADNWMAGKIPRADTLFKLADALNVDPRWLAMGEGDMTPAKLPADLPADETDLVSRYRDADPRWRLSLRLLSYLATEEQREVAQDVNIILARVFGKHPRDIRYVSNERVEEVYGDTPDVAARKRVKVTTVRPRESDKPDIRPTLSKSKK